MNRREKSREKFEAKKIQRRQGTNNTNRPVNNISQPIPHKIVACIPEVPVYKFLIKIASRSRPDQLRRCVDSFLNKLSGKHDIRVLISADRDDNSMSNWSYADSRVEVVFGNSKSKIEAINADINDREFDILVAAADDMLPVATGYDEMIAREMYYNFPNLDGAVHFNDGHRRDILFTLPVLGYNLYRKFNYVYCPEYTSLWCDNEMQELFKNLKRVIYCNDVPIEHLHPTSGKVSADALYRRNESFFHSDQTIFNNRSKQGFKYPPIVLSILICSLHKRTEMRAALLKNLNDQINKRVDSNQIEICLDSDNGELTIGGKRNKLLDRALGKFIVFIDDDDAVSPNYVDLVMKAIRSDDTLDCVGINGIMTIRGLNPRKFTHSIKYDHWYEADSIYYRNPNHWNPVRRDIALQARFPELNWAEDHEYSMRLAKLGLIKNEIYIEEPLYFYLANPDTSMSGNKV